MESIVSTKFRWAPGVVLALIIIVGVLSRLHGITGESVWFDEFTSLEFLNPPTPYTHSPDFEHWKSTVILKDNEAPTLWKFLKANHYDDPATMPVYDIIEYLWNHFVCTTDLSLRLFSIFIGALIIPLIYVFGRDLYGKTAGLAAALCVALSPIHRHFAQEIHMYGLMTLLALMSMYALFRIFRTGGFQWWVWHIVANVLLVWIHIQGAVVPFFEGVFLVLFFLTDIHRLSANIGRLSSWLIAHIIIAVPLVIFVATLSSQFWSAQQTESWQRVPTWYEFKGDLLADDCIGMTYQTRPNPKTWELVVSPERANAVSNFDNARKVGTWMMRFYLLAVAWILVKTGYDFLRKRRTCLSGDQGWKWTAFLLVMWLLPPIFLYVISVLWRPCIFPRYTVYSSLALYLLIGGAITTLPGRSLRAVAISILLLFYAYQDSLILTGSQRTEWKEAGSCVREHAKPDDLVLVQDWMWKRVFVYNMGPAPNVISFATDLDVLAEQCASYIELNLPSKDAPNEHSTAWVVIKTFYFDGGHFARISETSYASDFEELLRKCGLDFTMEEFGGVEHVLVYHVFPDPKTALSAHHTNLSKKAAGEFGDLALEFWRVKQFDTAVAMCRRAVEIEPKYARIYSYMGMAYKDKGDKDNALEAFRQGMAIDPKDYMWSHTNMAEILVEKGRYDEAIQSAENAIKMDAKYAWAYTLLGRAYTGEGEYDKAIDAFQKSIQFDPNDQRSKDGLKEAQERKANGVAPGPPAGTSPPPPDAPPPDPAEPMIDKASGFLDNGDYDGALAAFREAAQVNPKSGLAYAGIARVLLGKGDDAGALISFRKTFELQPVFKQEFEPLINALFETKNYEFAWSEVKRLHDKGIDMVPEVINKLKKDSGREQ